MHNQFNNFIPENVCHSLIVFPWKDNYPLMRPYVVWATCGISLCAAPFENETKGIQFKIQIFTMSNIFRIIFPGIFLQFSFSLFFIHSRIRLHVYEMYQRRHNMHFFVSNSFFIANGETANTYSPLPGPPSRSVPPKWKCMKELVLGME